MKKIFIFLIITGLLSACKEQKTPYRTALLGTRMSNFDPVGLSEYNEITFISQVCGRLTSVDESLNIEGDLAESWDISDDRKTYVFKIKTDRHFADGTPVTIEDIKFSLDRAAAKKESIASTWIDEVQSVSLLAPDKISLRLFHGNPRMLYKLSHPRFCVMKHGSPFLTVKTVQVPNSSGAYQVIDSDGDTIQLKVSNDYKEKAIEKNISVQFMDQKRAVEEFDKGRLNDLSFYLLENQEINRLASKAKILKSRIFWTWMIYLNPSSPMFKKATDRLEFIGYIDSDRLVKKWGAETERSISIIPEGMRGYSNVGNPLGSNKREPRFSCKRPLKVTAIEGIPLQKEFEEALVSELATALNCKSKIEFLEMGKFMKSYEKGDSDVYFSAMDTNSTDPLGFYRLFIKGESDNFLKYNEAKLNQAYHRLYDILPEKRSAADYNEIQKIFYKTGFGLGIGHPQFRFLYSKDVVAAHMNPLGMHLNRWWKVGRAE